MRNLIPLNICQDFRGKKNDSPVFDGRASAVKLKPVPVIAEKHKLFEEA